MRSFFSKLFGRTVLFEESINSFVNVVDANKSRGENNIFDGSIKCVDFDKRTMLIVSAKGMGTQQEYLVKFDSIITISRMRDGRLRMWINVED